MRTKWQGILYAAIVLAMACPGFAQADRRVALVIGNSAYKHTPKLVNAANDAADMTAALKKLGFEVVEGLDLDKAAMDRAVRRFAERLSGSSVGYLFYAGHGLQVRGENYLVPVDASLNSAAALDFEMVRLDLIQRTMERESTTNIIVIDACRDNPLARNLARALGTRSASIGRGLAAVESGEGTLISFSTQPGNVALDGDGRNSPFAAALLRNMVKPGEDLPSILINVRNEVMAATARRQVPWEHSALTAKFYFIPPKMTVEQQLEATYWEAVKNSTALPPIQRYLERYPDGAYAALAKALIETVERQEAAQRLGREAERARLEAEVKRLEEARRVAEAKGLEVQREADRIRRSAEAKPPPVGSTAIPVQQEATERERQLNLVMEELLRARQAAKAADEQREAAQKEASDAMTAADAAKAVAAAEAKRAGETKVAALPGLEEPALGPFDGRWTVQQKSNGACVRATATWVLLVRGEVAIARFSGSSREGTVKKDGAFYLESVANNGRPLIYSGVLNGKSGRGTYRLKGSRCRGTFTISHN